MTTTHDPATEAELEKLCRKHGLGYERHSPFACVAAPFIIDEHARAAMRELLALVREADMKAICTGCRDGLKYQEGSHQNPGKQGETFYSGTWFECRADAIRRPPRIHCYDDCGAAIQRAADAPPPEGGKCESGSIGSSVNASAAVTCETGSVAEHGDTISAAAAREFQQKSFHAAWGGPYGYGQVVRLEDAEAYVGSLREQVGQLQQERDDLAQRLGKPRCLDCNAAGISNCSHFDNCDGKWKYELESRAEAAEARAERLEKALREIMDGNSECACQCDDEDCCTCMARAALKPAKEKKGTEP